MDNIDLNISDNEITESQVNLDAVIRNKNDVLSRMNITDDEKLAVVSSIISTVEKSAAEGIRQHKIVAIPYFGRLEYNDPVLNIKKQKNKLSYLRRHLSKEDYKETLREMYKEERRKLAGIRKKRFIELNYINKHKKLYEYIYKQFGYSYVRMYIFSRTNFEEVPFDAEFENHYRELKQQENG